MSRRRAQPGDDPNPPDDIDDWVDELYGFMHMINTDGPQRQPQSSVAIFVSEAADISLPPQTRARSRPIAMYLKLLKLNWMTTALY